MIRFTIFILAIFTFSGCFFDEVSEKTQNRPTTHKTLEHTVSTEAELKAKTTKELAEIDARKEIDAKKLDHELALERARLELGKEQLSVDKVLELERIKHQTKVLEQESRLELQRYVVLLIAIVLIALAVGLYLYFKHRREDKQRSYDDNLEKYFRSKENEMRYKIANKVLDAVNEGDLSPEQQTQLIASLNTESESRSEPVELIEDANVIDTEQAEGPTQPTKDDEAKH